MSTPTSTPRPTKKTTVGELKGMLGSAGLETKGKKDTLWRRLLNHFKKSPSTSDDHNVKSTPSPSSLDTSAQTSTDGAAVRARTNSTVPSLKKRGKQPIRAFLCFDVEATCRGGKEFDWPNEIIEFPVVLLRWEEDVLPSKEEAEGSNSPDLELTGPPRLVIVDRFHTYVRPTWSTQLSEFCTNFTGITQEMVDASPTFPEVLKKLEAWMDSHGLRTIEDGSVVEGLVNAVWVTDGPWDLRDFVPKQLHITPCDPPSPLYLRQPYLNLKQAFQSVLSEEYRREQYALSHPDAMANERSLSRITTGKLVGRPLQEKYKGLGFYQTITGMLEKLKLGQFEGRQHCGLDDATNVARILQALVEKDILVEANGRLPPPRNSKKWAWMGKPGEVNWEEWMSDNKRPLEERIAESGPGGVAVPNPASGPGAVVNGGEKASGEVLENGKKDNAQELKAAGAFEARGDIMELEKGMKGVDLGLGAVVDIHPEAQKVGA